MKLFWKYFLAFSTCLIVFTYLSGNGNFPIVPAGSADAHLPLLMLGKYVGARDESSRPKASQGGELDPLKLTNEIIISQRSLESGVQKRIRHTSSRRSKIHERLNKSVIHFQTMNESRKITSSPKNKDGVSSHGLTRLDNTVVILDEYGLIPFRSTVQPQSKNDSIKVSYKATPSPTSHILNASSENNCLKKILLWEEGSYRHSTQAPDAFFCPEIPCDIEVSYSNGSIDLISDADAVILHHKSLKDFPKMISKRKVGQKWIIATKESPMYSTIEPPNNFRSVYDWIMTYRQGADFSLVWGYFDRGVPEWREGIQMNWASGKNKLITWDKSNCSDTPKANIFFVSRLNKYIPVSMSGQCVDCSCAHRNDCGKMLRQYKFYLALENVACRDYVTECFWERALMNDIVPIVHGPPKEDYERIAPPHSFIHIDDFKTVAELAKYLNKLDNNDTLYNEYFLWKKVGKVVNTRESGQYNSRETICEVADKLRQTDHSLDLNKSSTYENIMGLWWKGSCTKRCMPT